MPARNTKRYFTENDHRTEIELHVVEGESLKTGKYVHLKSFVINVPPGPAGRRQLMSRSP